MPVRLSERLEAVAACIPQDSICIDVGSDHGLLPVRLLQRGRVARAFAVDLRPKPLENARRLAREEGLVAPLFQAVLSDGLQDVGVPQGSVVAIAGMGARRIRSILGSAACKLPAVGRLVLQPNSEPGVLRSWLWEHGWGLLEEKAVSDRGKVYIVLAAERGRGIMEGSEREAMLGPLLLCSRPPAWLDWVRRRRSALEQAADRSDGRISPSSQQELRWLSSVDA
jgi:tRNA (adenine22-N1)-methyltransferase